MTRTSAIPHFLYYKKLYITLLGLALTFGGSIIIIPVSKYIGALYPFHPFIIGQTLLWLLLLSVFGYVVFIEKKTIRSIFVNSFSKRSILNGLLLAALIIFIISPLLMWAMQLLGLTFSDGIKKLTPLSIWILFFAICTAAFVEEILFRGYAYERLSSLLKGDWLSALIVSFCSALVHTPAWGLGAVIGLFVTNWIMTSFYARKRDLWANIIAHFIIDCVGLIIVPRLIMQAN